MVRMTLKSRVGADGILSVKVPVGVTDANREVQVTIEPTGRANDGAEEYAAWLRGLPGRWQGEFERPPQGSPEEREPLP